MALRDHATVPLAEPSPARWSGLGARPDWSAGAKKRTLLPTFSMPGRRCAGHSAAVWGYSGYRAGRLARLLGGYLGRLLGPGYWGLATRARPSRTDAATP